jgi:hypothetical protein
LKIWILVAWIVLSVTPRCLRAADQASPADERGGAGPEAARAGVGKWVGTQQIIFKERREWDQEREILAARTEAVRKEIAQVEERLAGTRQAAVEAAGRRAAVEAESEALRRTGLGLAEAVTQHEDHLRRLARALPAPLAEKVAPLYQRMPAAGAPARASVAERFQNVLGILNEINRMNGEITLASEIRTLSDGRPSEVRTVYLGLAQAYYLSAGGEAGIGRPGEDGWAWESAPDLAPHLAEVVEILQNKRSPRFVALPVRIQ